LSNANSTAFKIILPPLILYGFIVSPKKEPGVNVTNDELKRADPANPLKLLKRFSFLNVRLAGKSAKNVFMAVARANCIKSQTPPRSQSAADCENSIGTISETYNPDNDVLKSTGLSVSQQSQAVCDNPTTYSKQDSKDILNI